jgi:hypothetical protein
MSACGEYLEVRLPVEDLKGASRAIAPDRGSMGSVLAELRGILPLAERRRSKSHFVVLRAVSQALR